MMFFSPIPGRPFFRLALFTLLALSTLALSTLNAQRVKSTLSGVVSDPSGAFVAGAAVTLTHADSNVSSRFLTEADGSYTFPFLSPGTYTLTVTHEGFKTAVRRGIEIRVATDQRIDTQLDLGQVADSVEVKAEAPLLESVSASLGQVVDNRKITDLPLNGRNVLSLLSTIPGSSGGGATGSFASASNPSINGTRTTGNNFTVDGVSVNQEYTGSNGGSGSVYTPQVDAVSEFKVITSNYSAEYGRAMGGVVTINLKSGTNQYHGSLFEFLRNDKLNARNYFASPTAAKPTLRYNQFGGAGGGPLVHDKLFFFVDAEWTRRRAQATRVSTVPTLKMKAGDLSEETAVIYDPLTTTVEGTRIVRSPYPNKVVPASAIDPTSKQLIGLYPDPNRAGLAANYNINAGVLNNSVRHNTKIDWMLSSRDSISGRFSYANSYGDSGTILPGPGNPNATQVSTSPTPSFQISNTHTFSPRLVNELRFALQKTNLEQSSERTAIDDWRTKLGLPPIHEDRKLQFGFPNIMPAGLTALGTPYDVFVYAQRNWNIIDTLSRTVGRHFLKMGGSLSLLNTTDRIPNFPAGGYIFGGQFTSLPGTANTGRPVADLLIGWAQTAYAGMVGNGMKPNTKEFGLFFQDDFRVTRRLTLNLGLRYDIAGAPTTVEKQLWTFTPSCNCNRLSEPPFPTEKNNFSPRLGFAFQANSKLVLRGGYGVAYFPQFKGLSGFAVIPPALQQNQYTSTDARTPARTFRDTLGTFVYALGDLQEVAITPSRTTGMYQPNGNNAPYLQSWNLTLEHSPISNLMLGASYVGNKGTHMWINRDVNTLAQPALGPDAQFGGVTAQLRRPYPNAGRITAIENQANTSYQALQLKAEWRQSAGLSFLTSYTYGKSIDTPYSFIQDPTNRQGSRGLAPQNVANYFVHSMTYQLPFGAGRRWLQSKGIADVVLGGWAMNSIVTARSGFPVNPVNSSNGTGSLTIQGQRPDRIRDGNLPVEERRVQRWFDTGAFASPPAYRFGNSGMNVIEGPGLFNMDFSLFKNFRIREGMRLQFRAEAFNFTNSISLGAPNATIGTAAAGTITTLSNENRAVQLGLKFLF